MKRILILTLLVLSYTLGITQTVYPVPYQQLGSKGVLVSTKGGLGVDTTFFVPRFADTTAANLSRAKFYPASFIVTADNAFWVRNISATRWLFYGNGTGSTSNSCPRPIISGGIVTYNNRLTLNVVTTTICINNNQYTAFGDSVVLTTADVLLPRQDLIVVDTLGLIYSITGIPNANPAEPNYDASYQVPLTSIFVAAGATSLTQLVTATIWDENIGTPEWVGTGNGVAVNFNNTVTPYHLTKAADVGALTNKDDISFTGSGYSLATYNTITFQIKLKTAFATTTNLYINTNGSAARNGIVLSTGYGFNKNLAGVYQTVSVPLVDFTLAAGTTSLSSISFILLGSNGGFYIDFITIGGGIEVPTVASNPYGKVYRKTGTDSVFQMFNGVPQFAFIDSTGGGGGADSTTASNGLTLVGKDVRLGGALTKNTTIISPSYSFKIAKSSDTSNNNLNLSISGGDFDGMFSTWKTAKNLNYFGNYAAQTYGSVRTTLGKSAGFKIRADLNNPDSVEVSLSAGSGVANNTFSMSPTSTTLDGEGAFNINSLNQRTNLNGQIIPVLNIARLPGTGVNATNGIGQSMVFSTANNQASTIESNSIETSFTDVTASQEKSKFEIFGRNNGVKERQFSILSTGQLKTKYGIGTFAGTPTYNLGVDASGNIVETTAGGGSGEDTTKIPLSGTVSGKPVTGDIELQPINVDYATYKIFRKSSAGGPYQSGLKWLDDGNMVLGDLTPSEATGTIMLGRSELALSYYNSTYNNSLNMGLDGLITIGSVSSGTPKGLQGIYNYSPNYDPLTYVQRIYVDRVADSLRSEMGGGGSGISEVIAGSGLENVNDSTLKADTALLKTVLDARADSSALADAINLKQDANAITTFGAIFTDSFARGSLGTDYSTTLPGSTLTMPGSFMHLSGTPNNYSNFISRDYYTTLERAKTSVSFVIETVDATSYGIAVGWKSARYSTTFGWNVFATLSLTSTTQRLSITGGATLGTLFNDGVNVKKAISSVDSITLSIERDRFYYLVTYLNHTTGDSKTYSQLCTTAGVPFTPHNTAQPSIIHLGGDLAVTNLMFDSKEVKNPKAIFIGNSITYGQGVSDVNGRYPKVAFKDNPVQASINSGGADATGEVILKVPEIVSYSNGTVFLMLGANDLLYSVPTLTWQANYAAIVNAIHASGKGVIHLTPTPRITPSVLPLRTWLYATYPNDSIIDTYTLLKGATNILHADYNSGDGVHPNQIGQTALGNFIANSSLVTPMLGVTKGQIVQSDIQSQDVTTQQLYVSSITNGTGRLNLKSADWDIVNGGKLFVGGLTIGTNTTNSIATAIGNYGMWVQGSAGTSGDLILMDRNGGIAGGLILKTDGAIYGSNIKHASAKFEVLSTTQGWLQPRMTTAQRNAIASPSFGLSVYDNNLSQPHYRDANTWQAQVGMTFGTAAPATTPNAVGNFFLDTTNKKLYVSTGTASSADWNILN